MVEFDMDLGAFSGVLRYRCLSSVTFDQQSANNAAPGTPSGRESVEAGALKPVCAPPCCIVASPSGALDETSLWQQASILDYLYVARCCPGFLGPVHK